MAIRVPEVGDEIDGNVIEAIGPVAVISSNHHIVSVKFRGGGYGLVSALDYDVQRGMKLWESDNGTLQTALANAIEFPTARRGGSEQVYVSGRDAQGEFSGTLYHGEKKDYYNYGDDFSYRR